MMSTCAQALVPYGLLFRMRCNGGLHKEDIEAKITNFQETLQGVEDELDEKAYCFRINPLFQCHLPFFRIFPSIFNIDLLIASVTF